MRVSSSFGRLERDVDLVVGSVYLVSPLNPLKFKHRGRLCIFLGFGPSSSADNDMQKGVHARVKFLDINSRGFVYFGDLIPA